MANDIGAGTTGILGIVVGVLIVLALAIFVFGSFHFDGGETKQVDLKVTAPSTTR